MATTIYEQPTVIGFADATLASLTDEMIGWLQYMKHERQLSFVSIFAEQEYDYMIEVAREIVRRVKSANNLQRASDPSD